MVFQIQNPTEEEIREVLEISKNNPELLDSKELWILENFCDGDFE